MIFVRTRPVPGGPAGRTPDRSIRRRHPMRWVSPWRGRSSRRSGSAAGATRPVRLESPTESLATGVFTAEHAEHAEAKKRGGEDQSGPEPGKAADREDGRYDPGKDEHHTPARRAREGLDGRPGDPLAGASGSYRVGADLRGRSQTSAAYRPGQDSCPLFVSLSATCFEVNVSCPHFFFSACSAYSAVHESSEYPGKEARPTR